MSKEFEKKLPSGATLKFNLAPFADAKDLYQVVAAEIKDVPFKKEMDTIEVYKSLALIALSSKKIEEAIWKCLERARYNEVKVNKNTFESEEARQDYLEVLLEVAKENIAPFMKSLYAEYQHFFQTVPSVQS